MSNDTLREELERVTKQDLERVTDELIATLRHFVLAEILTALATNRAQAEEIEKLKRHCPDHSHRGEAPRGWRCAHCLQEALEERDARTQEAAQAQARVKELEEAATAAEDRLKLVDTDSESVNFVKSCREPLRKLREVLAESSPTAALEAVVQRAREEERGKVRALIGMDETAWLVERNTTPDGQEYLFVDPVGALGWTTDNLKALRLSRKADAESLVAIVEDAVRVAEHAWVNHSRIKEESRNA